MKQVDFSLVVTMHTEGLLAHKTMRSLFEALERLSEAGYTYEIIVHIDNGDKETINYFSRYKKDKTIKIFENSFGDTGPSRNFAVKQASGKFIGFFDGDDLVSPNWFVEAIKLLESSKEEIVVHPEAILTFGLGQPNILTIQKDSLDINNDTIMLLSENRWCSVLVARKETIINNPYQEMKNGYGHEDYAFNIITTAKGIKHKIAKKTILFYRRSDYSRLSKGNKDNVVIPYMELFDLEKLKKFGLLDQKNKKKKLKEKGYALYKKIRNNKTLNYFIVPVAKVTLKVLDHESSTVKKKMIPKFVLNEWTNINHIDSQLYPYEDVIGRVDFYKPEEQIVVGNTICKIAKNIRGKTNYIFIVPWIVRGGADKVLFNYIRALKQIHPNWRFTVISTLAVKSPWAKNLPDYVDYIDFGNDTSGLPPDLQERAFSKLLVQLNCKRLHIINSEYAYNWVSKHMSLVKYNFDLVVSLFAWEYINGSGMKAVYSYDNPCLFEIFDAVKKVLTDNKAMIDYTVDNNGFDRTKFKVHYQPIDNDSEVVRENELVDKKKLRIMWAGRVVRVKMPELVAEIGKKLDPTEFSIDVYGEFDKDIDNKIFDNVKSIKYCGAYDGFDSLPTDKYDVLLYTSLTDGMPNVILEAAAVGLSIVASNDGGVGEFIQNGKTGILIKDYLNTDAYVKAFKELLEKPALLSEYAKRAQKLLKEQHSWDSFIKNVKEDIV